MEFISLKLGAIQNLIGISDIILLSLKIRVNDRDLVFLLANNLGF